MLAVMVQEICGKEIAKSAAEFKRKVEYLSLETSNR
jgi:hypothetical protein